MSNEMKALVKARPEEGLWMQTVPVPEPGPDEVSDQGAQVSHLRDRCPHLEMGRLVGKDRAGSHGCRARVLRRDR